MNQTFTNSGRQILKDLLAQCNEKQQDIFKRMYGHLHLHLPINEIVDLMDETKIDWAITQCEASVKQLKNILPGQSNGC